MQVTRQRRDYENKQISLFGRRVGRRTSLVTVAGIGVALAITGTAVAQTQGFGTQQVGQTTANGQVISSDQYIAPYGHRTVINDGKIMSSSVSPDGTHLAATVTDANTVLVVVDLKTGEVTQRIKGKSGNVGQEGPAYSPDGKQLWLGQTDGYTKYTVNADGALSDPVTVSIPADGSKHALAAAAVFSADGSTVYSAVNGQNRVVAFDAATGAIKQSWSVGNAPRGMAEVGNKLYVSNEGGRPARPGDTTINSYGTQVAKPIPRPVPPPPARSASSTWRTRRLPRRASTSACTRPRCTPRRARCSSPTPPTTTCRSSTPRRTRSSRPSTPGRGRRRRSATSPTR